MQSVGPNPKREAYRRALNTTLQAYLASMVALVDITRRVMTPYASTELATEFKVRNDAVRAIPGAAALRGLREYAVHYGTVPINFKWTVEPTKLNSAVAVDTPTVLAMDRLRSDARTELNARPEGLPLRPIADAYGRAMRDLHLWLNEALNELHTPDFAACNQLVAERNLLLSGGTHDGRDWPAFWAHVAENSRRAEAGLPQLDWQDRTAPDESEG